MILVLKKYLYRIYDCFNNERRKKKVTITGKNVYFHRNSRVSLTNGATSDNIKIDSNSRIFGALVCCSKGTITIGKFSQVGQNSSVRCVNRITIGSYTAIADHVIVCDNNNHPVNPLDRHIMQQTPSGSFERSWLNSDNAPITIGDDCWIGQYVRICKGVSIGNGSVVAANSVVTKDVPANCIVAGNPARVVKTDIHLTTHRYFGPNNILK